MSLEHLVVPESEKILKTLQHEKHPTDNGGGGNGGRGGAVCQKDWNNLNNKTDKVVLDYNPKCKTNILCPY